MRDGSQEGDRERVKIDLAQDVVGKVPFLYIR